MARSLLVAAAAAVALLAGPARAGGSAWLDAPVPKGWNKAGAAIPRPPRFDPDPFLEKRCKGEIREAYTDADRAVAKRGWKLIGAELSFGDASVVVARSGVDGMCRPLGYQGFVFSGGRFAGTLAPRSMDSRTDGAGQLPVLDSASSLSVVYARYASSDPLCCPSRLSTVRFRIDQTPAGPVLVPVSTTTVATEKPAAKPDAQAPATAAAP